MLDQIVQSQATMIVGGIVISLMGVYLAYRAGVARKEGIEYSAIWLFGSVLVLAFGAILWTAVGGGM